MDNVNWQAPTQHIDKRNDKSSLTAFHLFLLPPGLQLTSDEHNVVTAIACSLYIKDQTKATEFINQTSFHLFLFPPGLQLTSDEHNVVTAIACSLYVKDQTKATEFINQSRWAFSGWSLFDCVLD